MVLTFGRAAIVVAVAAVACGPGKPDSDDSDDPLLAFDTAIVRVISAADTVTVRVELAITDEQKTLGLMERRHLPQDAGMLFVYPTAQPESSAFWMYRTRIPLDIAFIDSTGAIRAIRSMEPCESTYFRACPHYPAGVPYRAALEVNRGFFAREGIQVGDSVLLEDTARRAGTFETTRQPPE